MGNNVGYQGKMCLPYFRSDTRLTLKHAEQRLARIAETFRPLCEEVRTEVNYEDNSGLVTRLVVSCRLRVGDTSARHRILGRASQHCYVVAETSGSIELAMADDMPLRLLFCEFFSIKAAPVREFVPLTDEECPA